jgi:DNA polymerase-3 subunit epsilon
MLVTRLDASYAIGMREIVLDTETTGMDPFKGDRIIEIGAVELIGHLPTGRTLQFYINPERDVPPEATAVHGITNEFLKGKPIFSQVYSDFLEFIGSDAILVIHNAEFDMKFINWELQNVGHPALPFSRVIDTLPIARKKYPGSPANLDALCRRFEIDNSNRTFHGALLDSQLLAEVYLELLGGRQHGLSLNVETDQPREFVDQKNITRTYREPRQHTANDDELAAHETLLTQLKDPLWKKLG